MMDRRPPRLAERLLELLLPERERDGIVGDLEEEFHRRPAGGTATIWYWGQALLLGGSMLWRRGGWGRGRGHGPPESITRMTQGREGTMGTMGSWLGEVALGLRVTLRSLARRKTYALLALTTIVLGVGAVTSAYGLLHHVVLRPLPFEEPERLVTVRTLYDGEPLGVTPAEYLELAEGAETLEGVAALVLPSLDTDWTWSVGGERRPLHAVRVTDSFFSTLGVQLQLGTLGQGTGGERRVVLSHAFWRGALAGDPRVVGSSLQLNAEPYVVTGVLPASFEYPLGAEATQVWIPFVQERLDAGLDLPFSHVVVGRLAPGADAEVVAGEMDRVLAGLPDAPGGVARERVVRPLSEDLLGPATRPLLLLTLAGVLVLLVASLNLSMLVAARNMERKEELHVRVALGATRGRILGHLFSEAGVLAILGGALSLALSSAAVEWLAGTSALGVERATAGGLSASLLIVAMVAAVVPALVASALPGFRVRAGMRALGSRGASSSRSSRRFAWALSATESGAVFVLLVLAAVVLRSLQEVTAVDPGFDVTSTVAYSVSFPAERFGVWEGGPAFATLLDDLEDRVAQVPGVVGVGTISNLPLSPEGWSGSLRIEGREELVGDGSVVVDWELVSAGYFQAMGIPVLLGRPFDGRDRADSEATVVINETLARRWWPDGGAVGARISGGGPFRTVVGVVGDVKVQGLHRATRGSMYLPLVQFGGPARHEVVVRTAGTDPAATVGPIRAALLEVEPNLALGPVRTLDRLVGQASAPFRLRAVLLGVFASLALLLGVSGIYGVTAHGVRSRRRDLGIRMAMGADGRDVVRGVMTDALLPVGVGVVAGLGLVALVTPALRGILFGVGPLDVGWLGAGAAILLVSAAAAVLPSALNARRIDPASMLRDE